MEVHDSGEKPLVEMDVERKLCLGRTYAMDRIACCPDVSACDNRSPSPSSCVFKLVRDPRALDPAAREVDRVQL